MYFQSPASHAALLKLTTPQLYVKKLAAKALYESLTSSGGAVIAGLDTSTGRALAVQVNDPSFMTKLESELEGLRRKLGAQGADWMPSSAEYEVSGLQVEQQSGWLEVAAVV